MVRNNSFMIYKIRALSYKLLYPVAKCYWFLFRPRTFGAGCIVEFENKILLIRNTYGDGSWSFPGGGVKKTESPEEAAKREVYEETGLDVEDLILLTSFVHNKNYKIDTVNAFVAKSGTKDLKVDAGEVLEARWFLVSDVPESELSAISRIIFNSYKDFKNKQKAPIQ